MMNSNVLILFGIPISALAFVYIVFALVYRLNVKDEVKISFNRFMSLYAINTEKWATHLDDYVVYYRDESPTRISIYFTSYFDNLRYRHFKNLQRKIAANKEINEISVELLKSWQNDINVYVEKYQHEIDKMSKDINKYEQKTIDISDTTQKIRERYNERCYR